MRGTGGGTNLNDVFLQASRPYDRIVILSDEQAWVGYYTPDEALAAYRQRTHADPHVYSFDLAGAGTMQLPQERVRCLAGLSARVFDIMATAERDPQALLNEIEAVDFTVSEERRCA